MSNTSCINDYCIAQSKINAYQEEFANKKKPVQTQIDEIRDKLIQFMKINKLTCVAITVGTDAQTKYLRYIHTSNIGELNQSGVEKAVLSIDSNDLKKEYKSLTDKLSGKKRKRMPAITIARLDLWESTLATKIRSEHLKESFRLTVDDSPERGFDKSPQARLTVPNQITDWVNQYFAKKTELQAICDQRSVKMESQRQVVQNNEKQVHQYFDEQKRAQIAPVGSPPVRKQVSQTQTPSPSPSNQSTTSSQSSRIAVPVNLTKKDKETNTYVTTSYKLTQKVSNVSAKVRITRFMPFIRQSIEDVFQVHQNELKSDLFAINDSIRQDLAELLKERFIECQNTEAAGPYLRLDKSNSKKQK